MGVEYPLCRYRIDSQDRIFWVDPLWLAFARENGATQLTESAVVGRSLWDFIANDATRQIYQDIHARLQCTGKSLVLPFRCDSPSIRRHMQLTITGETSGNFDYASLLLRAEPRRWLNVLESKRSSSEASLQMCSCCKRVLTPALGWLDVEDAYVTLRIFETEIAPQLDYTVCADCTKLSHDSLAMIDSYS